MTVLWHNIFNIMATSQVSNITRSLITSKYNSCFYFNKNIGRGEIIKKYGFFPSKTHLISSASESDSNSSDDEDESTLFRSILMHYTKHLFKNKDQHKSSIFFFLQLIIIHCARLKKILVGFARRWQLIDLFNAFFSIDYQFVVA